jgi:RNA polymerase sigma-B factor
VGVDPFTQTDERRTRDDAVMRYLPLARSLARRYRHTGEPMEDLEQVACIGLLHAIDRFDPTRGAAFTSFAVPTILGELRRHFRDKTWALRVPRGLQELAWKLERARDELTVSIGRQPTVAELADHLGTGQELVLQALELALAQSTIPIEEPGSDGEEDEPAARLPGRLDDGYDRAEDRAVLAPLLSALPERDARIVALRFCGDLTQDAIARRVGTSQMHVSRVLRRSLATLHDAAA